MVRVLLTETKNSWNVLALGWNLQSTQCVQCTQTSEFKATHYIGIAVSHLMFCCCCCCCLAFLLVCLFVCLFLTFFLCFHDTMYWHSSEHPARGFIQGVVCSCLFFTGRGWSTHTFIGKKFRHTGKSHNTLLLYYISKFLGGGWGIPRHSYIYMKLVS